MIDDKLYFVRVRRGGRLTIPWQVRKALKIEAGRMIDMLPIGEELLVIPRQPQTPQPADQSENAPK